MNAKAKILLVGAGAMGIEYTHVLKAQKESLVVVGRGGLSAKIFEKATGLPVIRGGIVRWLHRTKNPPARAIVAVPEEDLGEVTRLLIKHGVRQILVEKPGGLTPTDICLVAKSAKAHKAKVYIAYNRRFYASTQKAQEIIKKDSGVLSFNFEFTEWSHIVSRLKKPRKVKQAWFLANSSHVIDLAFFLGGKPKKLYSFAKSPLPWGPKLSVFAGAGVSKTGALFSYQANWQAPGRFGVEILTSKHRLIFRPLEKLQIQKIGTTVSEELPLDDKLDHKFKPGLYKEVEAFLGNKKNLPTIQEQVKLLAFYEKIN